MRALPAVMAFATLGLACSHDWDAYDPRLSGAGGATSTGTEGQGGAGSTTDTTVTSGSGASGSGGSTGSTTTSTTSSTTTSTTSGTGGGPTQITYPAVVAACIDTTAPDPAVCASQNGGTVMTVDTQGNPTNTPRNAYVRFDLDGTLAGKVVDDVTLRLVVANGAMANSSQTGEVWEVMPFDLTSLGMTVPVKVGSSPIAMNQGAVTQNEVVTFTLPTGVVAAGQSTYLGILPVSTDGVDYWNLTGADPPKLIVTYH